MHRLSIVASGIALMSLYGYAVHAARDPQGIGLVICFAWLLTIGSFVVSLAALVVRYLRGWSLRHTSALAVYFLVTGAVGYGGTQHAFSELLAG